MTLARYSYIICCIISITRVVILTIILRYDTCKSDLPAHRLIYQHVISILFIGQQ